MLAREDADPGITYDARTNKWSRGQMACKYFKGGISYSVDLLRVPTRVSSNQSHIRIGGGDPSAW